MKSPGGLLAASLLVASACTSADVDSSGITADTEIPRLEFLLSPDAFITRPGVSPSVVVTFGEPRSIPGNVSFSLDPPVGGVAVLVGDQEGERSLSLTISVADEAVIGDHVVDLVGVADGYLPGSQQLDLYIRTP